MITSELVSYITKQIQNNVSKDLIISKLIDVGWHREDIDEGFSSIDKYREPLVENNIIEVKKDLPKMVVFNIESLEPEKPEIKIETPKIETPKVWVPIHIPTKEEPPELLKPKQPQPQQPPRVVNFDI